MVDESLLPPPVPARKPFPWREALVFFVTAAALAGGTGLQRWLASTAADPVLHWLAWSSGVGLIVGAATGFARGRRLLWAAYGAFAPWVAAGLVAGAVAAVRPLRELAADRRAAACRAEGRVLCSVSEFDAACARRDLKALGPAQQSICNGPSCTQRWAFRGPFRPDEMAGKGSVLCSIVDGARSSVMAVADP